MTVSEMSATASNGEQAVYGEKIAFAELLEREFGGFVPPPTFNLI
jgi:hypothetical protein